MANVLEKEWYGYFEMLNEAEKKSVLSMLKTFLTTRNENAVDVSIEQYNKDIDESLAEAAAGNYITQDELEKKAVKW
jgi:hypothetical protein